MSKKQMVILLVVAVLGGGWYFFMASPDQQKEAAKKIRSAGYDAKHVAKKVVGEVKVGTVGNADDARKCRENIKRIESAKRAAGQSRGNTTGWIPIDVIVKTMGAKQLPKCPAGGEYNVGALLKMPTCSIGSNHNNDPSDDHVVRQF